MTNKENDVNTLRALLFDTINQLKDPDKPMEIDRAKTIADVAQVIINSAKVEVDHARITGGIPSTVFLPEKNVSGQPKSASYTHKIGDRHS